MEPSRVVIGYDGDADSKVVTDWMDILFPCYEKEIPKLITGTKEAEAIKLFSNSYLAMRLSFFNELDSFANDKGLDSAKIIKGVCLDPRIGDYYNVPGPGFGGHCLPKDTRQLVVDFETAGIPEYMIHAALEVNELRRK